MTLPPDGALNFRQTLPGLFRSGNLSYLSAHGREDLWHLGLTRLIDLRTRAEREKALPPFLGRSEYLNLSLLPYRNRALNSAFAEARGNADISIAGLEHGANELVSVLGAILDAPPGPVLVHCHAGKDRTGLVVALCMELAGETRDEIAADHVLSGPALVEFYTEMKSRKSAEEWVKVQPFQPCLPEDVLRPLGYLDEKWGGVGAYLSAYGFSEQEQAALAERLGT